MKVIIMDWLAGGDVTGAMLLGVLLGAMLRNF